MRLSYVLMCIILIGWSTNSFAQEFEVRSFEADPTDLAARRYPQTTVNDEPAALIKVVSNIDGMLFDSNIGVVDVERREAEYWVYVTPRERRITLMAPEFLAKDVSLPEPAEPFTVYRLVVTRKGMLSPITDLVRLTFRLNESNVFIRRGDQAPVSTVGNIAVFNIEKGEHSFRFIKEGYDEKTITLDLDDDDEVFVELTPGQVTSPIEPPGIIVVSSEQPGIEVYLNEQRVGVTPYQNTHISGEYSLLLRHPDYHDHYQAFSLQAGETMIIPTVNLLPRYGFYEVKSTPSGAEVLLNNSLAGRTPLSKTQISSEYHELTLRYPMYHDHSETFTIQDGDHKRFDVELKPAFGGLRLTSEPSGASVFIAGREVGTTPYKNLQKPSGRYNVRLSRDLYADAVETVLISDGDTIERFIPLAQNFGSLEVQADDADIYMDGERVGRGSHEENLTPGRYLLRATRPQHHDDAREVFIRLGQTEVITLAPVPKTGYVSITSEPFEASGAEIWIDGKRQEQVTPAVIALLEGNYEVRLKKEGFADAVESLQVRDQETTNKTIRMLSGKNITIYSEPSDAVLYVNGNRVGKTPYVQQMSFGSHQIRVVHDGMVSHETINVKMDGPSSFILKIAQRVIITSNPSGARVLINGEYVGNTPHNTSLLPGNYALQLSKTNFAIRKTMIRITENRSDYSYRLRSEQNIGLGYIFGGGDGVKGGFDLFFQKKMHLGLSFMGINPVKYTPPYSDYTPFSWSITLGYRFTNPVDFSLYAGAGTRFFEDKGGSGRTHFITPIIGTAIPIHLSPLFGFYVKADYWMQTEASGMLLFSIGIII